ncbi:ABC transporter ATP-binding protein [Sporosarcina sp. FSL W7-1349]|uniref:ABC transporter ATP-binding protein n=1 Tax=Sporosarcina sp. FSL W7-1349 TaxID=2921561 RepID=UPI0040468EBE
MVESNDKKSLQNLNGPVTNDNLFVVNNVKKYFKLKKGIFSKEQQYIKAVDDVSFAIRKGETLGIVGESGSGKSTLGRLLIRLHEATAGEVFFEGKEITAMSKHEFRNLRKDMQIIFQDPFGSLNPRMKVQELISEPFDIHTSLTKKEKEDRVIELLNKVGLDPEKRFNYPHELSGGQRQRVGIARAIALEPKFILADEAVSALDVSVQAQVINLLKELQKELQLTYLFIAHGLNVVRHISDRIAVMYLGKIVEIAETDELFRQPLHPYTAALLSTNPIANPKKRREKIILSGEIPSPANPPAGCRFHTRCPIAQEICKTKVPELSGVPEGRQVACHFPLVEQHNII